MEYHLLTIRSIFFYFFLLVARINFLKVQFTILRFFFFLLFFLSISHLHYIWFTPRIFLRFFWALLFWLLSQHNFFLLPFFFITINLFSFVKKINSRFFRSFFFLARNFFSLHCSVNCVRVFVRRFVDSDNFDCCFDLCIISLGFCRAVSLAHIQCLWNRYMWISLCHKHTQQRFTPNFHSLSLRFCFQPYTLTIDISIHSMTTRCRFFLRNVISNWNQDIGIETKVLFICFDNCWFSWFI